MSVALWCVLVAAILPYVFTGLAKVGNGEAYDNRAPRAYLERTSGRQKRAHWAQLNSFEAFPPFAAGVIIAHVQGADGALVDGLAVAFVLARVAAIDGARADG